MVKLFIDPGHGGSDPGAGGNGLLEKNVTLSIATRIHDILVREYANVSVLMSRTTDQTVSLVQRTNMANAWGANFYLAIHINSGGGTGYEDYIHNQLSSTSPTAAIQRIIHAEVLKLNGLRDRGLQKADYEVLRDSKMDAVLTENGFIDTPSDAALMKNPTWLNNVALGHVHGLAKAFNLVQYSNQAPVANPAPAPTHAPTPAPAPAPTGVVKTRTIYLPPTVASWRVYPLNKAPIKQNAIGELYPSKFGGLTYQILGEPQPFVYIIQTRDYGMVKIYGGPDTAAVVR